MTSSLGTFDLDRDDATVLLETERLTEAPNRSPDGKFLVVNGDGHLLQVDLDAPSLVEIHTVVVVSCNSDHGISLDGTMLVISDQTRGESCLHAAQRGARPGGQPISCPPY